MRSAHAIPLALAMLLLTAGSAFADTAEGDAREVTLPGNDVDARVPGGEVNAGPAKAEIAATIRSSESTLRAKDPSCDLRTDVNFRSSSCQGPQVQASAPTAGVDYDVNVVAAFGTLRATEGASGREDASLVTTAATASDFPLPRTVAIAAAGASALTLLGYAAWRALKLLGLGAILPLYSHIKDEEILEDGNRARIFELIRTEPGVSTREVADRLGLAWGTVTHHLWKLEKRRLVVSKKFGKYRRYFVNGQDVGEAGKEAVAVLRVARTAEVARYIQAHPGTSQKEVGEGMGVSSSTVLWHVKRLLRAELITKVRDGKQVKYFPTEVGQTIAVSPARMAGAAPVQAAGHAFRP